MDNRTLLAIILSIAVIIGYTLLFPPQQPEVKPPQPVAGTKAEAPAPVTIPVAPEAAPAEEKELKVENEFYSAVLSSKGGTVKSWAIKAYKDKKGKDVILLEKPGVLPALSIGANDSFDLASVNFSVSGTDLKLDRNKNSGTTVFEYSREGISIRRTYTFTRTPTRWISAMKSPASLNTGYRSVRISAYMKEMRAPTSALLC
jgi:YidC/Oxa1 family membrane protein insertase